MFQMRRYVGENVARQMDGDLVPYEDAILFAEEQTKAAIEAAVAEAAKDLARQQHDDLQLLGERDEKIRHLETEVKENTKIAALKEADHE